MRSPFGSKGTLAVIIMISCILGTLIFPPAAFADLKSELQHKQDLLAAIDKQNKDKAAAQATATALKKEIGSLNTNIVTTQNTIDAMSKNIAQMARDIEAITHQITDKEQQIAVERNNLEIALNHMYIDTEANPILTFSQSNTISETVSDLQSYQSIETEIARKADEIEQLKLALIAQKTDLEKKQAGLQQVQAQQRQQQQALKNQAELKNKLLSDSISSVAQLNSTISDYQSQLRVVDGAIDRFLAALKANDGYVAAAGDFVVVNSQPWHFYQTDPRWGSIELSPGVGADDSMSRYGCLITAVSMVGDYYGYHYTPGDVLAKLQKTGGMFGDLLSWSGVTNVFDNKLDFVTGGREPFNARLADAMLSNGHPVIVRVNPPNSDGFHYIVVSGKTTDGKYTVEDPYFQSGRVYPGSWIDFMARLQPV